MSLTTDRGRACAVLAYLIIGIAWFFMDAKMRRNTYAKFHVKQAIVFIIFLLLINLIVLLFSVISRQFSAIVEVVIYTIAAILWILAIVFAAAGREYPIPVIGLFAKELDF